MARPSCSWRWGSCQPRISQLPCQFLHTRNHHQSHRLWMFVGCWGLMLNARTCQGMRFKAQLLHLPSSTQSIQLSWPWLQFQRLHPLELLNYRLMSQMQTRSVLYSYSNGLCWKPGKQFPVPFLRLPSRYISIIDHWACWQLVNFIWCHNADRRGLRKLLRVGQWKWGRICRWGRGELAGCTGFLGHCWDTWTGVGSSEQLWAQVTPVCLPAVILSALED